MSLVWIAGAALVFGAALSLRATVAERFLSRAHSSQWVGRALLGFMLMVAVLVLAAASSCW